MQLLLTKICAGMYPLALTPKTLSVVTVVGRLGVAAQARVLLRAQVPLLASDPRIMILSS
jgi:hypothetical protein